MDEKELELWADCVAYAQTYRNEGIDEMLLKISLILAVDAELRKLFRDLAEASNSIEDEHDDAFDALVQRAKAEEENKRLRALVRDYEQRLAETAEHTCRAAHIIQGAEDYHCDMKRATDGEIKLTVWIAP